MSNDPSALSGIGAGLAQDAEYDAVYAAVTATERGRWFLTEYANRNRHADTDLVVSAIARIEAAIGEHPAGPELLRGANISAAAERIADIAFELRDREADATLCDALDAAVREICDACTSGDGDDHAVENEPDSGSDSFDLELPDAEKFAAAAAALEASLTLLNDDTHPAVEAESKPAITIVPHDYGAAPQFAQPENPKPRWYIEAPDFVFHQSRTNDTGNGHDAKPPGPANMELPELPAGPEDDPADLFEPSEQDIAWSHAPIPPAEPSARPASSPRELRVAAVAAPQPPPRPDPLAALNALSDEERIALFG